MSRAATELAQVCRQRGVAFRILHGRGGSIGRGGGPASEAVLAQPAGTLAHGLRLTEQGEMIGHRYGDQPTARRNLDCLAAATLMASRRRVTPRDARLDLEMRRLSQACAEAYRDRVYGDPRFRDFFWSATPIAEIAELNIGSRPASRVAGRRIEDLRAIPWVFAWSQARFMLPGWYGFAEGAKRAGLTSKTLRELADADEIFATSLANMELALIQAHMPTARRYADLCDDKTLARRIADQIEAEHGETRALTLDIRRGSALLDRQPELADSVAFAARTLTPLHDLQLELLARRRRGELGEDLTVAIQLTIAGIAASLRNTG